MSDLDAQKDEILAIRSIFESDNLMLDEDARRGIFLASPQLPKLPLTITYTVNDPTNGCKGNQESFTVEYLPPIEFHFELPLRYPSSCPPRYLIACDWLDQGALTRICRHLDKIWRETRGEVLYSWFDFLLNELFSFLRIEYSLDISQSINQRPSSSSSSSKNRSGLNGFGLNNNLEEENHCSMMNDKPGEKGQSSRRMINSFASENHCRRLFPSKGSRRFDQRTETNYYGEELVKRLKSFDSARRQENFHNKKIDCDICFTSFLGSQAISFNCPHYYCQTCIKTYFEVQITSGQVHLLKCPEEKCDVQADPSLVKSLVNPELYQKYDSLLLASALSTLGDIVYCPRKYCQKPIITETNGDSENNLVTCPYCDFAFCILCKYSYHGVSPCRHFGSEQERVRVLTEYETGSTKTKVELEKTYGKQFLLKSLNEYKCELWMKERSKECPKCKARIEKIDGCNKMHCFKCHAYFCWLCRTILSSDNPYKHFRDKSSQCFHKLFEGVILDQADGPDDEWEEVGNQSDEDDDLILWLP